MHVIDYRALPNKDDFLNFCRIESQDHDQPAAKNMWHDEWTNHTNTLPYLLNCTSRFDGAKGEFFIVLDDGKFVACSGVYISDFCSDICIAGVRTWVIKKYRNRSLANNYLLIEHKKWAINRGLKIISLTFNTYNKNIIEMFKRVRLGENLKSRITSPEHIFFNGLNEIPYLLNIQNTPQWVIYEQLDKSFNFDWSTIRHDH